MNERGESEICTLLQDECIRTIGVDEGSILRRDDVGNSRVALNVVFIAHEAAYAWWEPNNNISPLDKFGEPSIVGNDRLAGGRGGEGEMWW